MPIYMDIHEVPGAQALDLAEAHQKDLIVQNEYRCKCITYWLDEERGNAFCLIEAPDEKMVTEIHRNSHGLVPNKVIEVSKELVQSFLGRMHDPEKATVSDNGLKVFSDSAFRVLLMIDQIDIFLLRLNEGTDMANEMISRHNDLIRKTIKKFEGSEVETAGSGFIISFTSAANALDCSLEILRNINKAERKGTALKMIINAGEPVAKSNQLFGDTIQLARRISTLADSDHVVILPIVKDLLTRDTFKIDNKLVLSLQPADASFVDTLIHKLEKNWQDSDFGVEQLCKKMSMSKSQLYRKIISLWDLSPNELLKEYRLEKALEMLKSRINNVAQTTFDSGFTSPSYFTKCFKKKFGLLPANYLSSLSKS